MKKSKIEKREEITVYGFDQLQKMVLGFMPGGHVIDGFLNYRSGLKQKRVLDFAESLKVVFESELSIEIDKYDFEREDFVDLFDSILIEVQRTRSEKKLNGFKAILVNNIRKKSDLAEVFINLIVRLNEIELNILNSFHGSEEQRKGLVDKMIELKELHNEKLSYTKHLENLANQGTIKPNESIAQAIKEERSVLGNLIKTKNSYDYAVGSINGERFEVSVSEYEYHLNNLIFYGLMRKVEIDPFDDGTNLEILLVSDFGKDLITFITI